MKSGRLIKRDEILKRILDFLDRIVSESEFKESLANEFMPSCISVISGHIDNPAIVKPALVFLLETALNLFRQS